MTDVHKSQKHPPASGMREDIHLIPTRQIKCCTMRKKVKTGLRQMIACFPLQHMGQLITDLVQVKNI